MKRLYSNIKKNVQVGRTDFYKMGSSFYKRSFNPGNGGNVGEKPMK
ncbi:hypothetical protein [Clostridium botulinum]|nr:hypothetical protein [Clostridium botulinum]MBY6935488.1 hypothetical protein [Clostridium botulinum]